jgi:hypothetical protein
VTIVPVELAVARDSVTVRLTRTGNSSIGWELATDHDDGYHVRLAPGEQLTAVLEQAIGRPDFLGRAVVRIENPYARKLSVRIVWKPRPVPGDAVTVLSTVTADSGFIEYPITVPDHELTIASLEVDRVAPISVLVTGWSTRVARYPGTVDTEHQP